MGCFGCSGSLEGGLRLRFGRDGDEVFTRYTVPPRFQGPPGTAHGGIVATLMDEVSCAAPNFLRDQEVMTGEFSIRYERPCPLGITVEARASIVEKREKYFVVEASLCNGETLIARTTGKFFPLRPLPRG